MTNRSFINLMVSLTLLLNACSTSTTHLQQPKIFKHPVERSEAVSTGYRTSSSRNCSSPIYPGTAVTITDPFAVVVISMALIAWQLSCFNAGSSDDVEVD
jgi:hypothetical protein